MTILVSQLSTLFILVVWRLAQGLFEPRNCSASKAGADPLPLPLSLALSKLRGRR
jgi:hypothetical protein